MPKKNDDIEEELRKMRQAYCQNCLTTPTTTKQGQREYRKAQRQFEDAAKTNPFSLVNYWRKVCQQTDELIEKIRKGQV